MTNITIPDSVTSIRYSAFEGCTGLTGITIPDSVTSIGYSAFEGCTGLTSVTIPESVTSIDDFAFEGCTNLTGIWVNKNNPKYSSDSQGVLFNKDKTKLVAAPGAIKSYTIPDGITSIDSYAFKGCTGLTEITIPDSVTSISGSVFAGCTNLTEVWVDKNNPDYSSDSQGVLFNKDKTKLVAAPGAIKSYTIPDSITSISASAFRERTSLTSITIPDSVTVINPNAFNGCTGLTSISYTGTVAEWKSLTKYELWNFAVPARFVQCMDGQVEL